VCGHIAPLDPRIVEIVEVVDHDDPVAAGEPAIHQVGADESCPSRDEQIHRGVRGPGVRVGVAAGGGRPGSEAEAGGSVPSSSSRAVVRARVCS
jgi:hypothetical protein